MFKKIEGTFSLGRLKTSYLRREILERPMGTFCFGKVKGFIISVDDERPLKKRGV